MVPEASDQLRAVLLFGKASPRPDGRLIEASVKTYEPSTPSIDSTANVASPAQQKVQADRL